MNYKGEKLNTIGQVFDKALDVAKNHKDEVIDFFDEYVHHIMECNGKINKQEAIARAKTNFGYFAGYFDKKTQEIIEENYGAIHPIFGSAKC